MSKIFIAIVTLLLAITTLYKNNIIENWGTNPAMSVYASPEVVIPATKNSPAQSYSLPQNLINVFGDVNKQSPINNSMISTRNLQSVLPARFLSTGFSSNINFNLPDTKQMALDSKNPMSFANKIDTGCDQNSPSPKTTENYVPRCQKGGINSEENYTTMNGAASALSNVYGSESSDIIPSGNIPINLPVASMGMYQALNPEGGESTGQQTEIVQPVIYNRLIYAQKKSFLRSLGDPIRGDLPITPNNDPTFQVSATPAISLNTGALSVMGGEMAESQVKMAQVLANSKGTSDVIVGSDSYGKEVRNIAQKNYQSALRSLNLSSNVQSSLGPVQFGQPIIATAYP